MSNPPSISIVSCTLNANLSDFKKSLESIKNQDYPKSKIEHIVMDGGSNNGTVELAKKYGCRVFVRKDLRDGEQVRACLGHHNSKNDLILMLQSDNIIIGKNWLHQMVSPFKNNNNVLCSFSINNYFTKNMSLLTKYIALIGATDPLLWYLGKSEKMPFGITEFDRGKIISKNINYTIIEFSKSNLPTIGDNGHIFRRSAISLVNKSPEKYAHVDAFAMLLQKGFNTYAIVNNGLYHLANPSLIGMIKRRVEVKKRFYDGFRGKRKYLVMDWSSNRDKLRLLYFIVATLTLIEPLFQSIKGYIRTRETVWFIHPIVCLFMLFGYSYSEVVFFIKNWSKTSSIRFR